VWGTAANSEDNIVWGTASLEDNVVWGTSGEMGNAVWGTSADEDNLTWGTSDGGDDTPPFDDPTTAPTSFDQTVWDNLFGTTSTSDANLLGGLGGVL
jgi:hypothetical protein